jgi:predicted AAA+ superfamily ATPase
MHWLRGGFPRSYLATSDRVAFIWMNAFVATFLQRDIPALGINIPSLQLDQFWEIPKKSLTNGFFDVM